MSCTTSDSGLIARTTTDPPEPGKKYVSMLLALNHCFSRGTIVSLPDSLLVGSDPHTRSTQHVSNKDPNEDPEFDPHYFEQNVGKCGIDPVTGLRCASTQVASKDLEVFLELVKYGRRLANVAPFKDIIGAVITRSKVGGVRT